MAFEFISTAEYYGEVIDCRALTCSFEFYQLTDKLVIDLATELVLWMDELLKEGFICKKYGVNKRSMPVEKILLELKEHILSRFLWSYGVDAYVMNPIVYNKKTMISFERKKKIELPVVCGDIQLGVAADYPLYWKELFPNGREDSELIKQKIIQIFREENKEFKSFYCHPDVQSLIFIAPNQKNTKWFHGSFSIDFSAFCLNGQLNNMAKAFSEFAKQIAEKYVNVNACVRLQPVGKTHKHYFYGYDMLDKSHVAANCGKNEWYPTYYLEAVEWLNIISPLAQTHLKNHMGNISVSENVLVEKLQGGGLVVRSRKEIDQYGISDALELKRLVYPALYPGLGSKTLKDLFRERDRYKGKTEFWNSYPRSDWAIVPVFEEEVKIVATYLVFSTIKKTEE